MTLGNLLRDAQAQPAVRAVRSALVGAGEALEECIWCSGAMPGPSSCTLSSICFCSTSNQQMLAENAFFTAQPDSNYGKATRLATKQAQPGTVYTLDGQMSIRLDRAWTAMSLSPSHSSDSLVRVWLADRSNRLYIADGEIVNLSGRALQVAALFQGSVERNGVSYPCTIHSERDEGRAFGASLLPMGKSRLVILCEVPKGLNLSSNALHLVIQRSAEKIEIHFG